MAIKQQLINEILQKDKGFKEEELTKFTEDVLELILESTNYNKIWTLRVSQKLLDHLSQKYQITSEDGDTDECTFIFDDGEGVLAIDRTDEPYPILIFWIDDQHKAETAFFNHLKRYIDDMDIKNGLWTLFNREVIGNHSLPIASLIVYG